MTAVKHLYYLKCFLGLSVDFVNLWHVKLRVMIYCCNKYYAVISKLTVVTLSFIPRGTSYHSYLIQNCKLFTFSDMDPTLHDSIASKSFVDFFFLGTKAGSTAVGICVKEKPGICMHTFFYLRAWNLSSLSQNYSKHKQSLNSTGPNSDHFGDTVFCPQGGC